MKKTSRRRRVFTGFRGPPALSGTPLKPDMAAAYSASSADDAKIATTDELDLAGDDAAVAASAQDLAVGGAAAAAFDDYRVGEFN